MIDKRRFEKAEKDSISLTAKECKNIFTAMYGKIKFKSSYELSQKSDLN